MLMDFKALLGGRARPADRPPGGRDRLILAPPFPVLYAVGDVHGRLDLLVEAERKILADLDGTAQGKLMVLLGDVIDRGGSSAGVLDHLTRPAPGGLARICLCGNHEQALLDFLADPRGGRAWLEVGGEATLRSYGIPVQSLLGSGGPEAVAQAAHRTIPEAHVAFLRTLPVALTAGHLVLVHAGMEPGVPLERQKDEDLMWIREPFLTEGPGQDLVVIHGHTVAREPTYGPGRLGIDTGAYIWGKLTVLRAQRGHCAFLD